MQKNRITCIVICDFLKCFCACICVCVSTYNFIVTQEDKPLLSLRTLIAGEAKCSVHAKLLPSCPALCDTMDNSLSGFSVLGIFQMRRLEWVAVSFSRGSS